MSSITVQYSRPHWHKTSSLHLVLDPHLPAKRHARRLLHQPGRLPCHAGRPLREDAAVPHQEIVAQHWEATVPGQEVTTPIPGGRCTRPEDATPRREAATPGGDSLLTGGRESKREKKGEKR
eukprot:g18533.t1